MSRVKITYPENTHYTTDLAVRISDINYGNHLGHDGMIKMLHEARVLFYRAFGYSEWDIEGVGTLLADLAIQYVNESFYGDTLTFEMAVGDITTKSCQMYYRVTRNDNDPDTDRKVIAIAKTGIVFFDFEVRSACRIPVEFLNKLNLA